jgi:hypothetical protein
MGCISAPKEFITEELNAAAYSAESITHFVGLFTEESDVVFVKFSQFKEVVDSRFISFLSENVLSIHPLDSSVSRIIEHKVDGILIGEAVSFELREEFISFRNKEIAYRGAGFLMRLFGVEDLCFLEATASEWFKALEKFRADQNFVPATLLEFIMTYERTRDFNRNDVGVLEDSARLLKQFYGLPDGYKPGSKVKGGKKLEWVYSHLQLVASLRNELLSLGDFSFISIINKINSIPVFAEFNSDLKRNENEPERFFQVMMIYLKLREMIRVGLKGGKAMNFWYFVKEIIAVMPKEAILALYMAGMRFGVNEFVSLFGFINNTPQNRTVEKVVMQIPDGIAPQKSGRIYYSDEPNTFRANTINVKKENQKKPTTRKKKIPKDELDLKY